MRRFLNILITTSIILGYSCSGNIDNSVKPDNTERAAPLLIVESDTIVSHSIASTVTVSVAAEDTNAGGSVKTYYWGTGIDGWDDSTEIPSYSVTSLSGGTVTVRWQVSNNYGKLSESDTFAVRFNRAPVIDSLSLPYGNTSWLRFSHVTGMGKLKIRFFASDPDTARDTMFYTFHSGPSGNTLKENYSGRSSWCNIDSIDSSSAVYYRLTVKDIFGDSAVFTGSFAAPPPRPPSMGMVLIPAKDSSFNMGSATGFEYEQPAHQVRFSHDFWMDTTEVIDLDFLDLMGYNPVYHQGTGTNPVEMVSWHDAARYCNARSKRDGLDTAYNTSTWECDFTRDGYRLPTEAEWEYSCRAGSTGEYYWGNSSADSYAFYINNSDGVTNAVAMKKPNAFGLYDMCGNVMEWCNDWYEEYDTISSPDPTGPDNGVFKVTRGGNWSSGLWMLRSSFRNYFTPSMTNNTIGFRVVRTFYIGSE